MKVSDEGIGESRLMGAERKEDAKKKDEGKKGKALTRLASIWLREWMTMMLGARKKEKKEESREERGQREF